MIYYVEAVGERFPRELLAGLGPDRPRLFCLCEGSTRQDRLALAYRSINCVFMPYAGRYWMTGASLMREGRALVAAGLAVLVHECDIAQVLHNAAARVRAEDIALGARPDADAPPVRWELADPAPTAGS